MGNKKPFNKLSSPEELSGRIKSTDFVTWLILSLVTACLIGFFVWACLTKITFKISGTAQINEHVATLKVEEKQLSRLAVGQKVYISSQEGKITTIEENSYPIATGFDLENGEYDCYIVVKVIRPIDYFKS